MPSTDERFTGQRLDQSTLYYYGARYYDPAIGRFISADTIVPSPANPQSLNRYSYCLNNPLRYTDPTGHGDPVTITATGTAVVVVLLYGLCVAGQAYVQNNGDLESGINAFGQALGNGISTVRDTVTDMFSGSSGYAGGMSYSDTVTLPMPGQTWAQSKTKDSTFTIPNTSTTTTTTTYREKLTCVYALVAKTSGNYLCYLCDGGTIPLNAGDVWKYGITTQYVPGSDPLKQWRYTQAQLDEWGVRMEIIYEGTWLYCAGMELWYLGTYYMTHGDLPPGNRIFA